MIPPPELLEACRRVRADVDPVTVEALWSRIEVRLDGGNTVHYLIGAAEAMLTRLGGPDVRAALTALAMTDPGVQRVMNEMKEKVA